MSSAKQTPVRACKVTWRGDSKERHGRPGRRGLRGGRRASSAREPIDSVRDRQGAERRGRRPVVPAVHASEARRVLCPSCRRQLERGASYCGSCGTPLNGASAPLELVLADATRVPVVAEMTIGRAPGRVAGARRPVGLARARADLRRRGARGRGLQPRDVAGRRAGDRPAPLRDGAKIRLGDAELRVERRRDAAEAGRTIVVRAGASLLVPSVGAPRAAARRRTSGCGRGCARATRSSGSTRPRGGAAGCCATSQSGTFLRLSDNDALAVPAARRLVLAGRARRARRAALRLDRAGAARAAAVRPRRARVPRGRGRRRQPLAEAPHGPPGDGCSSRARRSSPGSATRIESALPARRVGVLHAPGADRAGGADRARASRRSCTLIVGRYGTPFVVAQQVRLGRPGVPARALRGGRRARDSRTG